MVALESEDVDDLGLVARYFRARTGVDPSRSTHHARHAIHRAMKRADCTDPRVYVRLLDRERGVFDALVEEMTVGESYFFRDAWHFDLLAERLLPSIRERRAAGGPGLRAWSAGCAAGEEPYSLAMLLADHGLLDRAFLLGTDLSAAALARARRARYRPWSLRGEHAERARPWVEQDGALYRVTSVIREAVIFRLLNLASDLYPSTSSGTEALDVVFCRNVLIYFDEATVEMVAQRLAAALRPGGWLVTGPSDPPLSELAALEPIVTEEGVVYRRPTAPRRSAPQLRTREHAPERTVPPGPAPRDSHGARGGSAVRGAAPAEVPANVLARLRRMSTLSPDLALAQVEARMHAAPKSVPLALLRATLLVALDRPADAEEALRAMLELDPNAAIAHFMRGTLRLRAGDPAGARACWTRAETLAGARPTDEALPHGDGETAGRLADAARRQLHLLEQLEAE
ncbi:MAG TPA: CheR family methyltransferase [Sandaracinaceae bacterium LLY-WYZ-13_1]|nr:CheR family methyltransferase [Sandaracinaceae bacterium LLY-WYZ-13_1]